MDESICNCYNSWRTEVPLALWNSSWYFWRHTEPSANTCMGLNGGKSFLETDAPLECLQACAKLLFFTVHTHFLLFAKTAHRSQCFPHSLIQPLLTHLPCTRESICVQQRLQNRACNGSLTTASKA